jgi:phosphoribosylglycinamide formyltransferase 2
MAYGNLAAALSAADTDLKLFGKPEVRGSRRLGVGLALGASVEEAREKARAVVAAIEVKL